MRKPYLRLTLTLLMLTHVAAGARDLGAELTDADILLGAGEYDLAFAEYAKHAQDNPLAQFNLGLIEHNGWGRAVDLVAGCHWFEQASAGDIPMAQQMVADCYRLGLHAPASAERAAYWYQRAVANGLPTANYWWGRMLIEGSPGGRDIRRGRQLCELAAQAGAVEAQLYLAHNYYSGEVIPEDKQRGLYWYERASQSNNAEAQYHLGQLIRQGVLDPPSPDSALHLLESAAAQGYQAAYLPTAELYFNAPADPRTDMPSAKNLAKSYLWLRATLIVSENLEEKRRAEQMLQAVIRVMPKTWEKDLDRELEAHFARVSPQQGTEN